MPADFDASATLYCQFQLGDELSGDAAVGIDDPPAAVTDGVMMIMGVRVEAVRFVVHRLR